MASKRVEEAVTQSKDKTWSFECPVNDGTCGANGVSFITTDWPTKAVALARAEEHVADHKGKAPMSTLEEFREKHGLSVNADGKAVVTAKDI